MTADSWTWTVSYTVQSGLPEFSSLNVCWSLKDVGCYWNARDDLSLLVITWWQSVQICDHRQIRQVLQQISIMAKISCSFHWCSGWWLRSGSVPGDEPLLPGRLAPVRPPAGREPGSGWEFPSGWRRTWGGPRWHGTGSSCWDRTFPHSPREESWLQELLLENLYLLLSSSSQPDRTLHLVALCLSRSLWMYE